LCGNRARCRTVHDLGGHSRSPYIPGEHVKEPSEIPLEAGRRLDGIRNFRDHVLSRLLKTRATICRMGWLKSVARNLCGLFTCLTYELELDSQPSTMRHSPFASWMPTQDMNAPARKGSEIEYVRKTKPRKNRHQDDIKRGRAAVSNTDRSGDPDKENINPGLIRGAPIQEAKNLRQVRRPQCTSQGGPLAPSFASVAKKGLKAVQQFNPEDPGKDFRYVKNFLWHKGVGQCDHNGPCEGLGCECVRNKTTCKAACKCGPSCVRQFPTCSCEGPCDAKCYCLMFNRECTPGKCLCSCCPNVFEGRNPPKLVVRTSTIKGAGRGLFADEDIKNGTFLGEYKGEIYYPSETRKVGGKDETENRVSLFRISSGKLCHLLLDPLCLTF